MAADGYVYIDTKISDEGMKKGFQNMKADMGSVADTAKEMGKSIGNAFSEFDVSRPIARARAKIENLQQQLASTTAEFKVAIAEDDDSGAQQLARKMESLYGKIEAAREKLAIEVEKAAERQAAAEEKASQRAIKAAQKEAATTKKLAQKNFENLTKPARRFNTRLREIISGALVFNIISAGLRSVTSYFGTALKANRDFSNSFSRLQGALLTAFQPIYEYVLPAIISLIDYLTVAVQVVGKLFAALSGKTYSQMQKNAESLNNQANSISGVGNAAEKAKKQLMGFDEINKLNEEPKTSGGGGGIASGPIFEEVKDDQLIDNLENILRLVAAVGAALLTWKIASTFLTSMSQAAGLAIAVGSAVLFATSWADAFANGIDWENLSGMLLSMVGIAGGLALAFGTTGAAIGLLVSGVALVVLAFKEWTATGELSAEACAALVAGIMAIGAAIGLLTGSWIPVVIAAIVGFITAAATNGDKLKAKISEILDFFGDGADWLEDALHGLIDFISNVFAGNWDAVWNGIASIAKSAINGVIGVINRMLASVTSAVNQLFALLSFQIDLPGIGSVGLSLPQFTAPQIPYLAKGAVIPPNAPFAAVLGDQTNGRNLEAPEDLIRQIVREESGGDNGRLAQLLETLISVVEGIEVGDETIGRAAARYNRSASRTRGY